MDKQSFDTHGVIDSMSCVVKQSNAAQLIVDDKPVEADTSSMVSMQGASCAAASDALPYKDDGDGAGVKRTCFNEYMDSLQLKKQRMNDCSGVAIEQDENCGQMACSSNIFKMQSQPEVHDENNYGNAEDIASKESMVDGAPGQVAAVPEVPADPENRARLLYLLEQKIAYTELLRREMVSMSRLWIIMKSLKLVQGLLQIDENSIAAPAVPVQRPLVFYGDLYVEDSEDENNYNVLANDEQLELSEDDGYESAAAFNDG